MNTSGGKLIFEVDSPEMYNLIPNDQYFYDAFLGVPLYKTLNGVIINPWLNSGGNISGLATGYIPVATSSTSVGDSWFYQDADNVFLTDGKLIKSANGQTRLSLGDGTSASLYHSDGSTYQGAFSVSSTQTQTFFQSASAGSAAESVLSDLKSSLEFTKGQVAGILMSDEYMTTVYHTEGITLNAPVYVFTQLTASTVVYLDGSNNLISLANDVGFLANDGSGTLSWQTGIGLGQVLETSNITDAHNILISEGDSIRSSGGNSIVSPQDAQLDISWEGNNVTNGLSANDSGWQMYTNDSNNSPQTQGHFSINGSNIEMYYAQSGVGNGNVSISASEMSILHLNDIAITASTGTLAFNGENITFSSNDEIHVNVRNEFTINTTDSATFTSQFYLQPDQASLGHTSITTTSTAYMIVGDDRATMSYVLNTASASVLAQETSILATYTLGSNTATLQLDSTQAALTSTGGNLFSLKNTTQLLATTKFQVSSPKFEIFQGTANRVLYLDGNKEISYINGVSGSFTTVDLKTVTVTNGIITAIVA